MEPFPGEKSPGVSTVHHMLQGYVQIHLFLASPIAALRSDRDSIIGALFGHPTTDPGYPLYFTLEYVPVLGVGLDGSAVAGQAP